jgi:hypothetical protein
MVRRQRAEHREHRLLQRLHRRDQHRRRQQQRVDRPRPGGRRRERAGDEARRHQPAEAVPEQHQRPAGMLGADRVDGARQVDEQVVDGGEAAAAPSLRPWPRWS